MWLREPNTNDKREQGAIPAEGRTVLVNAHHPNRESDNGRADAHLAEVGYRTLVHPQTATIPISGMLKAPFAVFDGYLMGYKGRVEPWGGSSRWQVDATGYELFMLLRGVARTIHTRLRKTIPGAQKSWLIISPEQTPSPEGRLVLHLVS